MTLIELCNRFARRTGLPTATTTTSGSTFGQLVALLDEVLDYLTSEYNFEGLVEECVFLSQATDLQGSLTALAPKGYSRICRNTFFDRTENLQIQGALTDVEWQAQKSMATGGPYSWFRLRGGNLYLLPSPPAGHTMAFEYMSNWAVADASGNRKRYASLDTDTFLLPDDLLLAGLRWRWKSEKGFDYAEELRQFELLARSAAMTSQAARAYSLDGGCVTPGPGIIIPTGNWKVPT